jgi:hypothetical protein
MVLLSLRKVVFYGTAFACGFLVEKGHSSQYFTQDGLLVNTATCEPKKGNSWLRTLEKLPSYVACCYDLLSFLVLSKS